MTVSYGYRGEMRVRCFSVGPDGELVPEECQQARAVRTSDKQPGLGDVVARATKAVGIQPCGKCRKRQESLNKATPTWASKVLGRLLKPSGTDVPQ